MYYAFTVGEENSRILRFFSKLLPSFINFDDFNKFSKQLICTLFYSKWPAVCIRETDGGSGGGVYWFAAVNEMAAKKVEVTNFFIRFHEKTRLVCWFFAYLSNQPCEERSRWMKSSNTTLGQKTVVYFIFPEIDL